MSRYEVTLETKFIIELEDVGRTLRDHYKFAQVDELGTEVEHRVFVRDAEITEE